MALGLISILSATNLICFASFVVCMMLFFVLKQDFLLKLVREEKARSEALLLNILPKEIADRLKGEQRLIADGYSNVSILFADIVGFTQLSATMQPIQLVALLNEVFSYFDSPLKNTIWRKSRPSVTATWLPPALLATAPTMHKCSHAWPCGYRHRCRPAVSARAISFYFELELTLGP